MSYILDALRRLEQDKEEARKASNPIEAVLHFNPAAGGRSGELASRSVWVWIVFAALLAALISICVTLWLTRKSVPIGGESPKAVRSHRVAPTTATTPRPSAIAPAAPNPSEVAPAEPSLSEMAVPSSSLQEEPSSVPDNESESPPDLSMSSPATDLAEESGEDSPQLPPSTLEETVVSATPAPEPAGNGEQVVPEAPEPQPEPGDTKVRVAGSEEGFSISAIVWSPQPEGRFAVVNQKMVHPGEWVGGRQVVEILEDAVVFEGDGDRFQVKIHGR